MPISLMEKMADGFQVTQKGQPQYICRVYYIWLKRDRPWFKKELKRWVVPRTRCAARPWSAERPCPGRGRKEMIAREFAHIPTQDRSLKVVKTCRWFLHQIWCNSKERIPQRQPLYRRQKRSDRDISPKKASGRLLLHRIRFWELLDGCICYFSNLYNNFLNF